jgi:Flp pilus assembly protein TadG
MSVANAGGHRETRTSGQALTEFALILPLMVALLGISIDISRLFSVWTDLESATRHAAQWIAGDPAVATTGGYYDSTDTTNYCGDAGNATGFPCMTPPTTDAKTVVDREMKTVTFTKVYSAPDCSTVTVPTVFAQIHTTPSTAATDGGSAGNPIATADVIVCLPFHSFFSYPLLTHDGAWQIGIERTFTVVVGR